MKKLQFLKHLQRECGREDTYTYFNKQQLNKFQKMTQMTQTTIKIIKQMKFEGRAQCKIIHNILISLLQCQFAYLIFIICQVIHIILFIFMSSALQNHINFRLLYNLNVGTAIYIVIDSDQYSSQPIQMTCNHRNRQGGYHDIWETQNLYFSELLPPGQLIKYYYFKADFYDPTQNRQDVNWEGTNERMDLEFFREIYTRSYCIITDQCDQLLYKMDEQGNPYRPVQRRIFRKSMQRTLKFHISLIHQLPLGQWLFAMMLPNELAYGDENLMSAVRTKRIPSKKRPTVSKWTIDWVLGVEEAEEKYGGLINIAFFESYYYHRINEEWKAIIQKPKNEGGEEQIADLQSFARKLENKGIPYVIEYESIGDDGEIINHVASNSDDFVKTKFRYECTDEINPHEIYGVWVVSPSFPKQLMKRSLHNPKIWEVEIEVETDLIRDLEYYFQVKTLAKIQEEELRKTIIRSTVPQKMTEYRPGNNVYIQSKSRLVRSYSSPQVVYHAVNPFEANYSYTYSCPDDIIIKNSHYNYTPYRPFNISIETGSPFSVYRPVQVHNDVQIAPEEAPKKMNIFNVTNKIYGKLNSSSSTSNSSYSTSSLVTLSSPTHIVHDHTVKLAKRINETIVDLNRVQRNIQSLNNSRTYLRTKIQKGVRYLPKRFREFLEPVKLKLLKKSQIQQIIDDLEKEKEKLIKKYPQISEKFQMRQQKQNQDEFLSQKIQKNELNIFIIQMITAVKQCGKADFTSQSHQNVVNIIQKYFKLPSHEEVFTICYYLNHYMVEKGYNRRAPHNSHCQKRMQEGFLKAVKNESHLNLGMSVIRNNKLYEYLKACIQFPFHDLRIFGSNFDVMLMSNEPSILLMRTLINYTIIYSLLQNFNHNFPSFSNIGCSQLGPFCRQQRQYSNTILLSTLEIIRNKYIEENSVNTQKIEQNEQEMIQVEEECVNEIEQATDKQVAGLVNLQLDLYEINKELEENGKSQAKFKMMLKCQPEYEDLLEEFDEIQREEELQMKKDNYQQGIQAINPEELSQRKLCKARDILNHQYLDVVSEMC